MTLKMNIFNVCKQREENEDDDDFQEVNMIETSTQDQFSNPPYITLYDLNDDIFTSASHDDQTLHIGGWKPILDIFEELSPYDFKRL